MKKKKIVEWFVNEWKEEREKDRRQKEWAEMAERKKEEVRELNLTKNIKEAIQKERAEAGREAESEGTTPPWEKQGEPGPPPPYNPQILPPLRPPRCAPPAGLYMMQGAANREEEWKETEVDVQGIFTGYQRMRHPKQEDREPINMEGKAAGQEDESPRLDLPCVGNRERNRVLQEHMKDWYHMPCGQGMGSFPLAPRGRGRVGVTQQQSKWHASRETGNQRRYMTKRSGTPVKSWGAIGVRESNGLKKEDKRLHALEK